MKKVYLILVAIFMVLASAVAQTGTYTGTATAKETQYNVINETIDNVSVDLNASDTEGFYVLSIHELNLDIADIPAIEMDGIVITGFGYEMELTKEDAIEYVIPELQIPDGVPILGGQVLKNVAVTVTLESGSIVNDTLRCELKSHVAVMPPLIYVDIFITFEGALDELGHINISKAEPRLVIYPTLVENEINVADAQNAEYIIYTINGAAVKHGVTDGTVNVADLESGIYIIQVDGRTAKFIKK